MIVLLHARRGNIEVVAQGHRAHAVKRLVTAGSVVKIDQRYSGIAPFGAQMAIFVRQNQVF